MISGKAYFSAWFSFPNSVQKDVLLIIERAQRPLTLTASNFGVMSLQTYLQVCITYTLL